MTAPEALLHPHAREIAESFCAAVHGVRPDLLDTVYVTGSGQTDDWQPGHSDVDLVLVTARPVRVDDAAPLTALHAATSRDEHGSGNPVDGVYLTTQQLADGPEAVSAAPQSVNGAFTLAKLGQLSWVTWLELAASPVGRVDRETGAVSWSPPRGATPEVLAGAAAFSSDNLATYWAGVADELEAWLAGPESPADPTATVPEGVVTWGVLGAPRLLATIEHGRVLTKSASGLVAAERWPAYAGLVSRCRRARTGEPEAFTVADAHDGLALLRRVVAAGAEARPGHASPAAPEAP